MGEGATTATGQASDTEVLVEQLILLDADADSLSAELEIGLPSLFDFTFKAKIDALYVDLYGTNGNVAVRLRFDLNVNLPDFGAKIDAEVRDAQGTADLISAFIDSNLDSLIVRGRPEFENVLGYVCLFVICYLLFVICYFLLFVIF